MSFLHCHVHSFASILDGCGRIKDYIEKVKEYGMPGLTITDHGNMSATYDLFTECKKANVNPVIGCEFYVTKQRSEMEREYEDALSKGDDEVFGSFDDSAVESRKETADDDDGSASEEKREKAVIDVEKAKKKLWNSIKRKSYHQIVLVKNEQGWKNACKLNYYSFQKESEAHHDHKRGDYYHRPRITREFLFEAGDGLITTSSCMASEINRLITANKDEEAFRLMAEYKKRFGHDFYIELQINEVNLEDVSQKKINSKLIEIADALDIKKIMTGDVHYVEKGSGELQDIVIAIARDGTIYDENAFKLHARSLHFHDREDYYEMNEKFGYGYTKEFIDECLDNTLEINEKCSFEFTKNKNYPKFTSSQKESRTKIVELCKIALKKYATDHNFDEETTKKYVDRLKHELEIINKNGYTDYFLIVWDIIQFCIRSDIKRGIGRGSVGSSLVAFLLGISGLDPIKFDLYFERFINPEALAEPDIDMDFDSERRDEIYEYLKQKWGEDCVVRIGSYTEFHIKSAIHSISKAYKRDIHEVKFVNEMLPDEKDDNRLTDENVDAWFEALEDADDSKMRRVYQWYLENKDVIHWFKKMFGDIKGIGQHAGGVLITPTPIYHFIPVNRIGGTLVTAFAEASSHKNLSALGLLKLDVLALNTVTSIRKTIELVKEKRGVDISNDVWDIDLENQALYDEFAKGDNFLVFQFESTGISDLTKLTQPRNIHDVAGINACYRPSVLGSGAAFRYGKISSGREEVVPVHPLVDEILKNTHGVIVYQEQVSRIINACAGIPIGKAELIRRAIMDKKYPHLLVEFNEKFVDHCVENGMQKEEAENVKEFLLANSGYAFNASHSYSYAYIAMQTLYLKMYYSAEYYAVELSMNKKEYKIGMYIMDAMKRGVNVTEPDVKVSRGYFFPATESKIACGFNVIKGLGPVACQEIERMRAANDGFENMDIVGFATLPWKKVNKKHMGLLAMTGSFLSMEKNTKLATTILEHHAEKKKDLNKTDRKGNVKYSIDHLRARYDELVAGDMRDFSEKEMSQNWKKATGFANPFKNKFKKYMSALSTHGVVGATAWSDERPFVYGEIMSVEERPTKKGGVFYKASISDGIGEINFKVWENQMKKKNVSDGLREGVICCVELTKDTFGYTFKHNGRFVVLDDQS